MRMGETLFMRVLGYDSICGLDAGSFELNGFGNGSETRMPSQIYR